MNNSVFETTFIVNNPGFETTFSEVNDDLFDDVMKYFDFPLEDVKGSDGSGSGGSGSGSGEDVIKDYGMPLDGGGGGGGCVGGEEWDFQKLEPPPVNVLAGLSSGFSGDFFSDNVVKSDTVSCDGSSKLNQQSSPSSTKASSSRSITLHSESADVKGSIQFQTSSPVSVLESSSSCSAPNPAPISPTLGFLVKRSRSKRRRASTSYLQFTFPLVSSTSSTSRGSNSLVGCELESESYLTEKPTKKRQKKKRNLTLLSGSSEIKKSPSQQPVVRKCMHCEVTKTPQWREGPMGPKTLCNACGVRYRSGRLLPEYRPAASPTFVPSLHSNSHKKVVEMRKKAKLPTTVTPSLLSTPPRLSFG